MAKPDVIRDEEICDQVVGVRLPLADVRKLDRLAKQSFRKRADVVRLLLSQADWKGAPDIFLSPIPREPAVAEVPANVPA